jgi:hypothetical protein
VQRNTPSLPDEPAEKAPQAVGGERQESLREVLAAWDAETPVSDELRSKVREELDQAGLFGSA